MGRRRVMRAGPALVAIGAALAAAVVASCAVSRPPPAPPWQAPLAREAPLTGTIYDTGDRRPLSPAALVDRLAAADFVLLGERHDNPDHHRLQAWIVNELLARGRPFAVAFEMIDGDQAAALNAYLASVPANAEGLGKALDWDNSGWPPWALYQPIAAAAMEHGAPILAANLPSGLARAMARQGLSALPAPLAARLHLDRLSERPADRAVLAAHEAEIQAAHCNLLPERALAPFALAQYARDAHMAQVMADRWQSSAGRAGVILIAGAGHGRTDRGVPFHLARLAPASRILSLAFIEANADEMVAQAPSPNLPYDFAWYTARLDDSNGCDKMSK